MFKMQKRVILIICLLFLISCEPPQLNKINVTRTNLAMDCDCGEKKLTNLEQLAYYEYSYYCNKDVLNLSLFGGLAGNLTKPIYLSDRCNEILIIDTEGYPDFVELSKSKGYKLIAVRSKDAVRYYYELE